MTFPTTGILDNFNRADGGLGANWTWDNVFFASANTAPSISSNKVIHDIGGLGGGGGESSWNTTVGPNCEVYCTVGSTINYNKSLFVVFWRWQDRSGAGGDFVKHPVYAAYFFDFVGDGSDLYYQLIRIDEGGTYNTLSEGESSLAWGAGDAVGAKMIGADIELHLVSGGTTDHVLISYTDATPITGAGYIGFEISDAPDAGTTCSIDNFGGGTLSAAPVADFSGTPTSGAASLSVDFTDASTNTPTSWAWDFGDGDTDTVQNPTHVYTAAGTYTVALIATNDAGSDTKTRIDYIVVSAAPAPVADFHADVTSGDAPLTVTFTDDSTNSPTSWLWNFGDGGNSTAQNPVHIYAYAGTYTVTLTATNASGSDAEVKVDYITVTQATEVGAAIVTRSGPLVTGSAAIGLKVTDVAIAANNALEKVVIDASAELRVDDNTYTTLTNNGTLNSLAGDRAVFDASAYATRHTNDKDASAAALHHSLGTGANQAATGNHTHAHNDLTSVTANQHHNQAHILGTGGDHSDAPANQANGFVKRNAGNAAWEEVPYGVGANTVAEGNHIHGYLNVAIKSGDYTLTNTDQVVVFTASATATLPAAAGTGQTYRIVCRAGTLTIDGNSSDTVKGALTQTLGAGEDLIITDTATGVWE